VVQTVGVVEHAENILIRKNILVLALFYLKTSFVLVVRETKSDM
jgi:hypothetical protein